VHLFGEAEELVPLAVLGSEGIEHHRGQRVESVGESGFALNEELHNLIADAYLFGTLVFAAPHIYTNPSANPIHLHFYFRIRYHKPIRPLARIL
jgi:hypothetical protein